MGHRRDTEAASPRARGRRPARGVRPIAAMVLLVACTAACTTGTGGGGTGRTPDTAAPTADSEWSVVTPPDIDPTALTTTGNTVLVGGASPGRQPRLEVRRGTSWEQVRVTPSTGYGARATLLHVAADPDGRVVAIGTATGGAHLNPRWTAWIGSIDGGLVEEPQSVETFGGPDAGGITGVTGGSEPLVVGTWSLSAGGLTVATWRHSGAIWQREPGSAALSGSAVSGSRVSGNGDAQTTATAAATTLSGTVIVGLETSLPRGAVHQQGVAWVRPRGATGWTRINLDASHIDSAATDVACTGDACVIVGRLGDRLAAWRLVGTEVASVTGVPVRTVGRYAGQPRVAMNGSRVAIADGVSTVMVSAPVRISAGDPSTWRVMDGPPGEVRALTLTGDAVQLLARTSDERQVLYTRDG